MKHKYDAHRVYTLILAIDLEINKNYGLPLLVLTNRLRACNTYL